MHIFFTSIRADFHRLRILVIAITLICCVLTGSGFCQSKALPARDVMPRSLFVASGYQSESGPCVDRLFIELNERVPYDAPKIAFRDVTSLSVSSQSISHLCDWLDINEHSCLRITSLRMCYGGGDRQLADTLSGNLKNSTERFMAAHPHLRECELTVRSDGVKAIPPFDSASISSLRRLRLDGFAVKGVLSSLLSTTNLTELVIAGPERGLASDSITEDDVNAIACQRELQDLTLVSCINESTVLTPLASLPILSSLGLCRTTIRNLDSFRSLRTLRLGHVEISDQAITTIASLPNLGVLVMHSCIESSGSERRMPVVMPPLLDKLVIATRSISTDRLARSLLDAAPPHVAISLTVDSLGEDTVAVMKNANIESLHVMCEEAGQPGQLGEGAEKVQSAFTSLNRMTCLRTVRVCVVAPSQMDEFRSLLAHPTVVTLSLRVCGGAVGDARKSQKLPSNVSNSIKEVNIIGNGSLGVMCGELASAPSLRAISFDGGLFRGGEIATLGSRNTVERLTLTSCDVSPSTFREIGSLKTLQSLSLDGVVLTSTKAEPVGELVANIFRNRQHGQSLHVCNVGLSIDECGGILRSQEVEDICVVERCASFDMLGDVRAKRFMVGNVVHRDEVTPEWWFGGR